MLEPIIEEEPRRKVSSGFFKSYRINKGLAITLIILGVTVGSMVTSFKMGDQLLLSSNRRALYEIEYHQSDFYRDSKFTQGSNPFDVEKTIERLYQNFPKSTNGPSGDKNILQMWRKRPENCEEGEFPNLDTYQRWMEIHPHFNYTFYTNKEIDAIIKRTFINTVPEIWEAYRLLPKVILQSDFGRYILIFLEGGLYSDIDVWPHTAIYEWIDTKIDDEINMVIGVEADPNGELWEEVMPRRLQFLQWTFKAKKRHPAIARLIANIVRVTFKAQLDSKLTAYFDEFVDQIDPCRSINVLDWTGPGIFTDTMYSHFNRIKDLNVVYMSPFVTNLNDALYGPDSVFGESIDWKTFTGVKDPVLIDDILVLPQRSFRAEENCEDICYVQHHFSGSWKQGSI